MRSLASGISNDNGDYYYVSYPPFSFLLAYAFFELFSLVPSLNMLSILNIFLQGITAYLLYLIVCVLYKKRPNSVFYPAIFSSAFYIFSTQSLWCHVYMYFADTLIQAIWSACLLLSLIIFKRDGVNKLYLLLALGSAIFLAVYTEWLGLLYAAILFLYSFYACAANKTYLRVSLVVAVSTSLAVCLTLWQYSLIDGFQTFITASADKYMDRSGASQDSLYFLKIDFLRLMNHYWRQHKANFILILFLALITISLFTKSKRSNISDHFFLISLATIPVLLHHVAFLEFSSMHDFSTLKSLIPICLIISFLLSYIENLALPPNNATFLKKVCIGLMLVILNLNIILYYSQVDFSLQNMFTIASHQINISSTENDAIYSATRNDKENGLIVYMGAERAFSTQIQLITKRNILGVPGHRDALSHMKKFQNNNGVLYVFDQYGRLVGIESMVIEGNDL